MGRNHKLIKTVYLSCLFLCIFLSNQKGYNMDDENAFWQNYQKWFEYKKTQPLNELQKETILYLEKANLIYEKADETWGISVKNPDLPRPQDALKIVNKCLYDFSKLKPPSIAEKHFTASVNLLKIIKKYHLKRMSGPNSGELEQLSRNAISYEGIQYSEYFDILKKIGLFDNIEEEMKKISGSPEANK